MSKMNLVAIEVEVTDTFAGEANYSWKRTERFYVTNTERSIVRKAKQFAGFTGLRCRVDSYGDIIQITPTGRNAPCQTCFVTWGELDF